MMKKPLLTICTLLCCASAFAEALSAGFYTAPVVFEFLPEYSYNKSWGSMANFDLKSTMPVGRFFEFQSGIQLSTANVYTVNIFARPRIPLKIGDIFFEVEPYFRAIVRDRTHDAAIAVCAGYRFDYLSFQLGWFGRWMIPFDGGGVNQELTNIIYRVEVFCRPQYMNWNLSFCVSNIDDFQLERWQQPLFMINGRYDINDFLRLSAGVEIKPTGMFHEAASFYGATARVGVGFLLGN